MTIRRPALPPRRRGPAVVTPTRVPGLRAAIARWADTLKSALPRLA